MKKLVRNFSYPDIPAEAYHFGAGEIVGNILRPDGDWRPYTPPGEEQRRNGVESSTCFIEAQQHTLATILEEQYDLIDQNFSARYNLIFTPGVNSSGGDPLKAAQSFRDKGLIPDAMLPFSDVISNWEEFRSFLGGDRDTCENEGKRWRSEFSPKYDIVVRKEMDLALKYRRMRDALKFSPLPMSVAQGYDNGQPKPKGAEDIHMVELVYIDDQNRPHIWDTYAPFYKVLAPAYDPDFAMRWTIEKEATKAEINIFIQILQKIGEILGLIAKEQEKPVVVPEPPKPEPEQPKYHWDTPILARHSVRMICDEEGLSVPQKNTLCATIACESGFNTKSINYNKVNGKVVSTDYGICQWNDYYHGKEITPEEAVNNPEKAVRLMCKYWKQGQMNQWVCYANGAFARSL